MSKLYKFDILTTRPETGEVGVLYLIGTSTLTPWIYDGANWLPFSGGATPTADDVSYDNTDSGLTASNVQDAIDEVVTDVSEKQDDLACGNLPDNADLNDYFHNGHWYAIPNRSYTNLPVNGATGLLEIIEKEYNTGVARLQRFSRVANNQVVSIWERCFAGNAWRNWKEIELTENVPTKISDLTNDSINQNYEESAISTTKSMASSTSYAEVAHTSSALSAGTYLIVALGYFPSNSTGRRAIRVSTTASGSGINYFLTKSSPAINGAVTYVEAVGMVALSTSTTLYLQAYQNSGGDMSVQGRLQYIKLV